MVATLTGEHLFKALSLHGRDVKARLPSRMCGCKTDYVYVLFHGRFHGTKRYFSWKSFSRKIISFYLFSSLEKVIFFLPE